MVADWLRTKDMLLFTPPDQWYCLKCGVRKHLNGFFNCSFVIQMAPLWSLHCFIASPVVCRRLKQEYSPYQNWGRHKHFKFCIRLHSSVKSSKLGQRAEYSREFRQYFGGLPCLRIEHMEYITTVHPSQSGDEELCSVTWLLRVRGRVSWATRLPSKCTLNRGWAQEPRALLLIFIIRGL